MKFSDFVCFEAIVPELASDNRDSVITELAKSLEMAGKLEKGNCDKIIKAVIKRENEASTGMGKGIAIPHVKSGLVSEVTATVGRSSKGVDFSALDKQPVYSVILLISPQDNPDMHLQAMETVFRNIQDEKFRKFLRQLDTAEGIEDLLKEADEN